MKSNEELLTLAARALGLNVLSYEPEHDCLRVGPGYLNCTRWSPLHVAVDTQDLLVRLRMSVASDETWVSVWVGGGVGHIETLTGEPDHDKAAFARAVVWCAALTQGVGVAPPDFSNYTLVSTSPPCRPFAQEAGE